MEDPTETAYMDQAEAASQDANTALKNMEEQAVEEEENVISGELPAEVVWSSYIGLKFPWVDDPKLMKRLTYCKHASLRAPGIFVVSANRANHVDCLQCGSRRRSRTMQQDLIPCDLCGESKDEGFHETILQAGFFLITANLCPSCQTEQDRSVEILSEKYDEYIKDQEDEADDDQ